MQLTLIPMTQKKINFGVRHISSYLKAHGHNALMMFVVPDTGSPFSFVNENIAKQIVELSKDSAAYGISLFSHEFKHACEFTSLLKKFDPSKPVVWGGAHAILDPEECIKHCDVVCLEEGEIPMTKMLDMMSKGKDFSHVGGLWIKKENGEIIKNPISGFVEDLDSFDFPDFLPEGKWCNDNNNMRPLDKEWMKTSIQYFARYIQDLIGKDINLYTAMTSRGCPHRCTYCSNAYYLDKFKGKGKAWRYRSVEHVIQELELVKREFPCVNGITFIDDDLLARPLEDLKLLAVEYKKRIGLPFTAYLSPWSFNREKIAVLLDAGLIYLLLGVQSCSERVNKEVFNRNVSEDKLVEIINALEEFKKHGLKRYVIDIILDNPYETPKDKHAALMFLRRIPRNVKKQLYSLVFFPKTELTARPVRDGIISSEDESMKGRTWRHRRKDLYSAYEFLMEFHHLLPSPLFWIMSSRPVFGILKNRIFGKPFYGARVAKRWLDDKIVKTIGQIR